MSDRAFCVLIFAILAVVCGGLFWLATSNAPPCTGGWNFGGQTGTVTYHGHKIVCFHGDLVKVKP